jgi:hypothetical protein
MLLDHRTYTVRAGCLRKQMALYEKHGLAVQKRHFGEPLAWLVAETGDINSYVHIWVYEDAADRSRRRAAMMADPEWQAYLEKNAEAGYLLKQESKLMSPASFAPLRRRSFASTTGSAAAAGPEKKHGRIDRGTAC